MEFSLLILKMHIQQCLEEKAVSNPSCASFWGLLLGLASQNLSFLICKRVGGVTQLVHYWKYLVK